ncbi:MAG TPA: histidine kinase, partial [Achromobacter sp.]|nr:histidine kinase [Achromobacter sp.]
MSAFDPSAGLAASPFVGRGAELRMLDDALARVTVQGNAELVLLAGPAGSGKSTLVDRLAQRAELAGASFAGGKSDQQLRDIPYAPITDALRTLTMAALGRDEDALAPLRARLVERLAGQGRTVAEIFPEIEHLIGRTAPLSSVPAKQAQQRVHNALLQTFSAFAQAGYPLVLFIDDLQWADADTLAWLKAYTVNPPAHVLLLGAYRDQDRQASQAFEWLIHADRWNPIQVTRMTVAPLSAHDVCELTAAVLGGDVDAVKPLGQALHQVTAGNPFFARQLLLTLMDDGVLSFDAASKTWLWNPADVMNPRYAASVVDLMVTRLERFPEDGRRLLSQMACVGLRSGDALLARIADLPVADVAARLQPLVDAGLLRHDDGVYVFAHDRVLESAYAMTPPAQRPHAHARIATLMAQLWAAQLGDYAFEIANHIELAEGVDPTLAQRVAFVRVLTLAGRRAKEAAAVQQAARYVGAACRLMQPDWGTTPYALAY